MLVRWNVYCKCVFRKDFVEVRLFMFIFYFGNNSHTGRRYKSMPLFCHSTRSNTILQYEFLNSNSTLQFVFCFINKILLHTFTKVHIIPISKLKAGNNQIILIWISPLVFFFNWIFPSASPVSLSARHGLFWWLST